MNAETKVNLAKSDPVLDKIIRELSGPVILSTKDVFHDLMSCIIEQQIHYRSTKKIFQRLLESAHLERLTLENFSILEEKALGKLKLSAGKIETIARILEFWDQHSIDWLALKDEEVIQRLSAIKGVGSWTIDMLLLYTLERPNIFPSDDFHLKEIMVKFYGLNPTVKLKAQMNEIAENWGEQKLLAVKHLLAWKEHDRIVQKAVKQKK